MRTTNRSVSYFNVARSNFWVTIPFNLDRLEHHHFQTNRTSNDTSCWRKMKVSNRIHFRKIWVTIATKWRHTPFYIRPNNLPQELFFETRRRDLELDIDVLRPPHTSRFFVGRQKIFPCRLVCSEFRQVCDKIGACRAKSDSARSLNVLSGLVG